MVLERLRTDAGGDRAGRSDDDLESVRARLGLFEERTVPLVRHYVKQGVRVVSVEVAAQTSAGDVLAKLEKMEV